LFGVWLLRSLGLPQDLLRDLAIGLLFLVAATLLWPRLEEIVQRPLLRLTRRPGGDLGGGFVLGAALGLVFVPCAGPVLAAITVVGATQDVGARSVVLTLAYATGAAVPMLFIAFGGRAGAIALRPHAHRIRQALGVVVGLTALAISFNLDRHFQTAIPGYTDALQKRFEENDRAQSELRKLRGATREAASNSSLRDYGAAPEFAGISEWINSKPLTMRELRGKVVLVDFWTYSCINCLRTFPYLKAWNSTYGKRGLVIVGVHTPEFAFERVPSNVRSAVRRLGLEYPVAVDNEYGTWNAYQNQYWPAKYLIDRSGRLRYFHFGEGDYDTTEARIRTLLGESAEMLPVANRLTDRTPRAPQTPETYLGYQRLARFADRTILPDQFGPYRFPDRPLRPDELAYAGTLKVTPEEIVAGLGARLRLNFTGQKVHLVLGGQGSVEVFLDGKFQRAVRVDRSRLYTLLRLESLRSGLLEVRFSPGVRAYAFTFG
jgi:thiol-disulfide isomerase/thioredoxin